jgi:hypothetical protein
MGQEEMSWVNGTIVGIAVVGVVVLVIGIVMFLSEKFHDLPEHDEHEDGGP